MDLSFISEPLKTSTRTVFYNHNSAVASNRDLAGYYTTSYPTPYTIHSSFAKPSEWRRVHVYREPTPFDTPPGKGYKAKVRAKEYISNKDYLHETYYFGNRVSLWPEYFDGSTPIAYKPHYVSFGYQDTQSHMVIGFPSDIEQAAQDQAVTNLYGSLHRRQDIALGVLLAELRDSIGLIGKALETILRVVQSLRKGRVSDALSALGKHFGGVSSRKRLLNRDRLNRLRARRGQPKLSSSEYFSNMWLELSFGWLPIINDIYSLVEVINGSLQSEGDGILSFKGFGQSVESRESQHTLYVSHASNPTADFSANYSCRYASIATYKVNNDIMGKLAQLGLTNPLSVAWEVVPFSFVLDWFLPIGNWLNSLQADAGLELIQYCVSIKRSIDGEFIAEAEYYPEGGVTVPERVRYFNTIVCPYSSSSFNRLRVPTEEIPPMPFPSLSFSEILDPFKAITSLALLRVLT